MEHCLTYFNDMVLSSSALMDNTEKPQNRREDFFRLLSRVASGTLSMGAFAISALKIGCGVSTKYSSRRMVMDALTQFPRPIISFSTQYEPLLTALANIYVMGPLFKKCTAYFVDQRLDVNLRHCIACIGKVILVGHCQDSLLTLTERCGAQGLFEVNQIAVHRVGALCLIFSTNKTNCLEGKYTGSQHS